MTEQNQPIRHFRTAATMVLASLSLLLSGCFITPGKFSSAVELGEDQDFTFTYEGEIFFAALGDLGTEGDEQFSPEDCFVDGTSEVRECTRNEISGQRAEWEAGAEARAAERKRQAEQFSAMMGGIDPSDPEAIEEFRRLLLRQKGWNRVEDKGEGVFDVSYRIEGKLTHDFMFPVIEGVPSTNPFVQILLRDDGVVRITGSGFSAQNEGNPLGAMMGGMGALAGLAAMAPEQSNDGSEMPKFPMMEGTFSIAAADSMAILANNTDEGPVSGAGQQTLNWKVDASSQAAPTALIKSQP